MKKLNLQLLSIKEMLTKEQMKKVVGGYETTTTTTTKSPKIAACEGKKHGDECIYTYQDVHYQGTCTSFFAGPLFCSTLM